MKPRTFPPCAIWLFATLATAMGTGSLLVGVVAGVMLTVVYVLLDWAVSTAYEGFRS